MLYVHYLSFIHTLQEIFPPQNKQIFSLVVDEYKINV